jgi:hypothetical protein
MQWRFGQQLSSRAKGWLAALVVDGLYEPIWLLGSPRAKRIRGL